MKRLVIIGAGGHGREALDIVQAINAVEPTYDFLGFLDDGRTAGETAAPHDAPILGGVDLLRSLDAAYVAAIGAPAVRRRIVAQLDGIEAASLIHPEASIGSHVTYGPGLIMAAGARLTHAIELGSHVHLNVDSSISHDCRVGSFVTITPGARLSGGVVIGDGVWFGINACAIQGVRIGADTTVGAGAAVISDLPAGCTAVGVPAHPVEESAR
ncbi:acetyltransferase [Nocardioides jejuensis]|uniref:Acetyltransferase n=1 Tax=Nocardioides jejuensis TaxID=2502782 RepID=A0A4R1CHI3_9ACTN|nr:acetyltransferase [Nocardioides jejuensis]TCJ30207.1 acetyltransferase [Nocardioides jejuensis]